MLSNGSTWNGYVVVEALDTAPEDPVCGQSTPTPRWMQQYDDAVELLGGASSPTAIAAHIPTRDSDVPRYIALHQAHVVGLYKLKSVDTELETRLGSQPLNLLCK